MAENTVEAKWADIDLEKGIWTIKNYDINIMLLLFLNYNYSNYRIKLNVFKSFFHNLYTILEYSIKN